MYYYKGLLENEMSILDNSEVMHDVMDTSDVMNTSDVSILSFASITSDVSTASFNTSLNECGEMSLALSGVLACTPII